MTSRANREGGEKVEVERGRRDQPQWLAGPGGGR